MKFDPYQPENAEAILTELKRWLASGLIHSRGVKATDINAMTALILGVDSALRMPDAAQVPSADFWPANLFNQSNGRHINNDACYERMKPGAALVSTSSPSTGMIMVLVPSIIADLNIMGALASLCDGKDAYQKLLWINQVFDQPWPVSYMTDVPKFTHIQTMALGEHHSDYWPVRPLKGDYRTSAVVVHDSRRGYNFVPKNIPTECGQWQATSTRGITQYLIDHIERVSVTQECMGALHDALGHCELTLLSPSGKFSKPSFPVINWEEQLKAALEHKAALIEERKKEQALPASKRKKSGWSLENPPPWAFNDDGEVWPRWKVLHITTIKEAIPDFISQMQAEWTKRTGMEITPELEYSYA